MWTTYLYVTKKYFHYVFLILHQTEADRPPIQEVSKRRELYEGMIFLIEKPHFSEQGKLYVIEEIFYSSYKVL